MNKLTSCRYGTMVYEEQDFFIGKALEVYGEFSELEVVLFRKLIKAGDLVVEVGANIGCHTLVYSQFVGPTGNVLAFEPERNVFKMLCGNMAINNARHVHCFHQAVGDHDGQIHVPEPDYTKTTNFGNMDLTKDYSEYQGYLVPLIKLDTLGLVRCDFMKVDVEGMETAVLRGATETIKRCKPYLYVENDRPDHSKELKQTIEGLGYKMYVHVPPLYNPDNLRGVKENIFGTYASSNLLCLPIDRELPFGEDEFDLTLTSSKHVIKMGDMFL